MTVFAACLQYIPRNIELMLFKPYRLRIQSAGHVPSSRRHLSLCSFPHVLIGGALEHVLFSICVNGLNYLLSATHLRRLIILRLLLPWLDYQGLFLLVRSVLCVIIPSVKRLGLSYKESPLARHPALGVLLRSRAESKMKAHRHTVASAI
jgi:hypothetical protein